MAVYSVQDDSLEAIANAIRSKVGTSEDLVFPSAMVAAIASIETAGDGASAIVDEVVEVARPISASYTEIYCNPDVLGEKGAPEWYAALFLPVDVVASTSNATHAIMSVTDLLVDVGYRMRPGDVATPAGGENLLTIESGRVLVSSLASGYPISPGTYRLVVIA